MPWAESSQPFRLGRWLLVFTLKWFAHLDQGIELLFSGIELLFLGN